MNKLYIIEARDCDGKLLLGKYPQPSSMFGMGAISGMTDWEMSRIIYRKFPTAVLRGDDIPRWLQLLDVNWIARVKTW